MKIIKYQYLSEIENEFECSEYDFEEIVDNILNNERNINEITKEEENKLYNKILQRIEKKFTSMNYDTYELDNGIDKTLKTEN